jgi:hypothetical protein
MVQFALVVVDPARALSAERRESTLSKVIWHSMLPAHIARPGSFSSAKFQLQPPRQAPV